MGKAKAVLATVLATLACVGTVRAHHSGYMYATTPIWIEGMVTSFEPRDPHTFTTLEGTAADGSVRRWVVEGHVMLMPDGDRRALDAWCQQQAYEAVRTNSELTEYVQEIDDLLDEPCR